MICFALLGAGRLCNKTSTDRPSDCSRDRKSTRLNSSHGYISYAVFCLKKKKRSDATAAVLPTAISLPYANEAAPVGVTRPAHGADRYRDSPPHNGAHALPCPMRADGTM